jgi:putative FmdB family regulatory protein
MPIYEYRCESCGHELDALQKVSEDPLRDCPECQSSALRRLISAPSFRLKGDGWYETDFKSEKETKRNLVERPDDAKADKGETVKDGKKASEEKSSQKASPSSDTKGGSKSSADPGSKKKGSGFAAA